jgi:hypothetical protein
MQLFVKLGDEQMRRGALSRLVISGLINPFWKTHQLAAKQGGIGPNTGQTVDNARIDAGPRTGKFHWKMLEHHLFQSEQNTEEI